MYLLMATLLSWLPLQSSGQEVTARMLTRFPAVNQPESSRPEQFTAVGDTVFFCSPFRKPVA